MQKESPRDVWDREHGASFPAIDRNEELATAIFGELDRREPAPYRGRYFNGHEYGWNFHDGNNGAVTWWKMPYDLQMIELGERASSAIDGENGT